MSDEALILIHARRAEIKAERRRLDAEDDELDAAEKTIARLAALRSTAKSPTMNGSLPKTQKDFVLHTLRTSENGWFESVRELRDAVALNGKDIPMTTFQPLISSMVNEDATLVRDGSKVGLVERAGI